MATWGLRQPKTERQTRKEIQKYDVRTTDLDVWIRFVNVNDEKNVIEPIICFALISVMNIMKHTMYNDKDDVSTIKINVYIGSILSNKLIHMKTQCKQLGNGCEHLYVSICLTTQTYATWMSTIRNVAHPLQIHMWRRISKTKNLHTKDNVCIKNSYSNVKTQYVWVTLMQFA